MKQDDYLTLPYTQYGVYVTVDLRKTILPISLVDTQPHTTPHHCGSWELRGPLQTSRIVALVFSSPNQSSSIIKFDPQHGLFAKNDF